MLYNKNKSDYDIAFLLFIILKWKQKFQLKLIDNLTVQIWKIARNFYYYNWTVSEQELFNFEINNNTISLT